ncbi:SDR family oxidoreductase [Oenococcus oeni]|uniref:Short-chain alcohol dehydrogenase n=2 Tax=Oenococcus oeni TaxID=1247 RepID=Q04FC1_OENOB|nr:SDR family oxidoreductase [Oenococcus oeni]ABJ56851.1 Short-chain alcohol dehydrogenase [Oenococcus oeni PSU-1]AWW99571.1 short-chain dehydrogenase [Oenococcus oeni]EJN98834.1 Short-chain alcohol dehydrogenase [Oenococcus oeni AWRIB419]EJO05971.1 Short-chain alcohol dehydrogenase [Oenococcus oeni AWRIB553]EJO06924.1 Short-chain alcohol dehydrogenase [Oenococcus oeni AWRIB422]
MINNLKKKKILIIGGSSGFGKEIAKEASQSGAQVSIVGHSLKNLEKAKKDFEKEKITISSENIDASDNNQLTDYFKKSGNFDHIISMLGGAMAGGFLNSSIAMIRKTIEDKFFADMELAKISTKYLNKKGSLILTAGSGGHPNDSSGAIIGNQAIKTMIQGLALELAPDFRANAIAPTWTPTGLWKELSKKQLEETSNQMSKAIPLQRVANLAEVASAYLFLMSNNLITGQTINIDGGYSLV